MRHKAQTSYLISDFLHCSFYPVFFLSHNIMILIFWSHLSGKTFVDIIHQRPLVIYRTLCVPVTFQKIKRCVNLCCSTMHADPLWDPLLLLRVP